MVGSESGTGKFDRIWIREKGPDPTGSGSGSGSATLNKTTWTNKYSTVHTVCTVYSTGYAKTKTEKEDKQKEKNNGKLTKNIQTAPKKELGTKKDIQNKTEKRQRE